LEVVQVTRSYLSISLRKAKTYAASGEYIASSPLMGIIIGALAGGVCFVVFGLMRAFYSGGLSAVIILNTLKGRPIKPSPFVRIMVAAGIIAGIILGIVVSMLLGGVVGGVIEYMLMKMT
jgi:hypothetical protein